MEKQPEELKLEREEIPAKEPESQDVSFFGKAFKDGIAEGTEPEGLIILAFGKIFEKIESHLDSMANDLAEIRNLLEMKN